MLNNDEIIILGDSLLMINSKSMYNYLPSEVPWEVDLKANKAKLAMYTGISKYPKIYLLLQYSNNLCTQIFTVNLYWEFYGVVLRVITNVII